jgi:Ca-activated chloride channel homolog
MKFTRTRLFRFVPVLAFAMLAGCADRADDAPSAAAPAGDAAKTDEGEQSTTPLPAATAMPSSAPTDAFGGEGTGEPEADPSRGRAWKRDDSLGDSQDADEASPPPPAASGAPARPRKMPGGLAKPSPKPVTTPQLLPREIAGLEQKATGGKGEGKKSKPKLKEGDNRRELEQEELLANKDLPSENMYFEHYGTNPTIDTEEQPKSTFAVDVDSASFTMARSFLERGTMPAEAAIRVEEIVNAFDYGYRAPNDRAFSVNAEAAPSPNRSGYHFLHIGVKGKEVARTERKPANLIFVIDVSGSMSPQNRIGLVKRSLRLLVEQLDEADRVGIVTYGSNAREVLQPTSAHRKADIIRAIEGLKIEGATNAEAGLRVGYKMAARHKRQGGINRVILCSDGVANVGVTGPNGILQTVRNEVGRGITLTSVGFGMGSYNDVLMEQLADKGDGNYYYVDQLSEARRVFVDNLTGTLQVIAKDVKIQVDFDPKVVARYRLIGYENRALKAHQFDDDRVDAGELGAGHSVTALYEVKLVQGASGALGKVRVRFKQPNGSRSQLVETGLARSIVRSEAGEMSSPAQLSLAAAQFAEKLRGSYWARNVSYEEVSSRLDRLAPGLAAQPNVRELKRLVDKASSLDSRVDKFATHGPIARMDFDRVPVLR